MLFLRRIIAFCKRRPLLSLLSGLALFVLLCFGRYLVWPPVWHLAKVNPTQTSFMEYRQKQWKANGENKTATQTWKDLDQISRHLQKAVVLAEDGIFWKHDGLDRERLRLALQTNWAARRVVVGSSTITQQLAKNLYFQPDKSLIRKLQEALITWRLERHLEKERILELYLNVVEWGDGIFGAEAAARHYFGRSAARLNREQAAVLAVMLPNPLHRSLDSRIVKRNSQRLLVRMQREGDPR
jgi:monofunctional biosynthetic peptidoglycan transglycosylase